MAKKTEFSERFASQFELEEAVLGHWKKNNIFHKSQEQTKHGKIFSFYDGPPFITGIPHYATLLPSIAKDIIPRYQTMKGRSVRRIWGWDTHGLPAEIQVEKKLGLKTKKDVEEFGIENFVAENRKFVADVSGQWQWYIEHIGRWADMDNAYRTDQLKYMESVIWAFKELYKKELIYKGRRVSLFCTRCATPLSKFEITMDEGNYRDVEDPAVTVAFRLLNDDVYLLAWTTTPWTLPANLALAVDPKAEYVKVSDGKKTYILAHAAMERFQEGSLRVIEHIKGKKLVGEAYEPLYDFFKNTNAQDYKVYAGDFVDMDSGTGIVHIAPGFGEDDTKLGEQNGLSTLLTIDDEGHFLPEVKTWAGKFYRQANKPIMEELEKRELLFKSEKTIHSYPHCYRCSTPLIYKSQVSWYLKIDKLRKKLLEKNKELNWHPGHFGNGRFKHNLTTAPDWSLSRSRYWGTPIPVWETKDGETYVAGSVAEIEKLSGKKIIDLHRPEIDNIELTLPSGKKAKRVKEVLDVWFESGSMPYAQDHYPFSNKVEFKKHYPADFIVEYTGQLRGWFYYLHVLGNALFDNNSYKNVVVTGVMMGNDGRKMSKLYGNYPDPRTTIEKFGAESLRLYFMTSKIMNGEDMAISEDEIKDESRLLSVLQNSLQYFLTYSALHKWKKSKTKPKLITMDNWILARVKEFEHVLGQSLNDYNFNTASNAIRPFVEDLSTWYIRRSRDRFVAGDKAALYTIKEVLDRFALAVAPILPFSAERIYQALNNKDGSVHLEKYPVTAELSSAQAKLIKDMIEVREICSVGNMLRAQAKISLRQPLKQLFIEGSTELRKNKHYQQIIIDELNIKKLIFGAPKSKKVEESRMGDNIIYLDTDIDQELKEEGRLRELIRKLQAARKKAGLNVGQKVVLKYHTEDEETRVVISKHKKTIMSAGSFSILERTKDTTGMDDMPGEDIKFTFGGHVTKKN